MPFCVVKRLPKRSLSTSILGKLLTHHERARSLYTSHIENGAWVLIKLVGFSREKLDCAHVQICVIVAGVVCMREVCGGGRVEGGKTVCPEGCLREWAYVARGWVWILIVSQWSVPDFSFFLPV